MKIRAVLFDRDGTLTHFDKTWGPVVSKILEDISGEQDELLRRFAHLSGFDYDNKKFLDGSIILTHSTKDYCALWADELGITDKEEFLARIEALIADYAVEYVSPFPDTEDIIKLCRKNGIPVGMATNGTELSAHKQMQHLGLRDDFDFLAGYDSGFGGKPAPGQLLAFAEQLKIPVNEIAMVGDSLHDMHAAKEAGMIRVALTTGALSAEELKGECDYLFNSLTEFSKLLERVDA
ncbi:HAD family hydrolase [Polycladidibacter stylochi]|uniref:HAD family hydrolase n=1 Tax=Polycladidibacter stylochi TaxID=1807766 RepID=UPI00082AA1F4|nr:HAD family hydrolase [Pseudovibrio stylochi]